MAEELKLPIAKPLPGHQEAALPNRGLTALYRAIAAILPLAGLPVYVCPVVVFFALYLEKESWASLLVPLSTVLGVAIGAFLPKGVYQVYPREADGRTYAGLGLRFFRNFVADGDLFRQLAARVEPAALDHLQRTPVSLERRMALIDHFERCHWAVLLGTLPVLAWSVAVGAAGWAIWFLINCLVFNVYPILLQRHSRSRLFRIQSHRRCRS